MKAFFALLIATALCSFPFDLSANYEYYLFVVQWKPSTCYTRTCPSGYLSNDFNIHGMWPESWSGSYPADCNVNAAFDITATTKADLNKYWLSYNGDPQSFWLHEWTKHGSCVTPAITSNQYFSKALGLFSTLNILNTLKAAGISPSSNTITKDSFIKALKYSVDISCLTYNSKSYLNEVRFCFDLNYQQVNCKGTSSCGTSFTLGSA